MDKVDLLGDKENKEWHVMMRCLVSAVCTILIVILVNPFTHHDKMVPVRNNSNLIIYLVTHIKLYEF